MSTRRPYHNSKDHALEAGTNLCGSTNRPELPFGPQATALIVRNLQADRTSGCCPVSPEAASVLDRCGWYAAPAVAGECLGGADLDGALDDHLVGAGDVIETLLSRGSPAGPDPGAQQ